MKETITKHGINFFLEGKELICPECGSNINVITYTIEKIIDIKKPRSSYPAIYIMRCACESCRCEWEYSKVD